MWGKSTQIWTKPDLLNLDKVDSLKDALLLFYTLTELYINMYPQSQGSNIDLEALSGICG